MSIQLHYIETTQLDAAGKHVFLFTCAPIPNRFLRLGKWVVQLLCCPGDYFVGVLLLSTHVTNMYFVYLSTSVHINYTPFICLCHLMTPQKHQFIVKHTQPLCGRIKQACNTFCQGRIYTGNICLLSKLHFIHGEDEPARV